ncbi:MAG TPA: hypothetical protein VN612_16875, partial [Acidobacteriaceae bacterium]|nr:hypothetical protein [Acidobacteriaceae bacterium]
HGRLSARASLGDGPRKVTPARTTRTNPSGFVDEGGGMTAFSIRIVAGHAANDPFFSPDPMEAAA